MKKAIIAGATGLVGMAVARHFSSLGVDVLCLGRQTLSPEEISRNFGAGSMYLTLPMENIASLAERVGLLAWSSGSDCVFFNFAWRGHHRLTDGSFGDQVNNAIHAAEAARSARKLGCVKFVNAGTLAETFVEQFLEGKSSDPIPPAQTDYALAKMASRDMCKMVAYLEKIDYVHTRMSIPLARDLSRGTYVAATMKQIAEGKPYEPPTNKQLCDIVFIDDVARAYYLIGLKGKNKADYFIGSSRPATLGQYFERFEHLVKGNCTDEVDIDVADRPEIFDTETLYQDTGFVASTRFHHVVESLLNS